MTNRYDKQIKKFELDGLLVKGLNVIPAARETSPEGRIEDLEVLEDYRNYDRYQEVYNIWSENNEK